MRQKTFFRLCLLLPILLPLLLLAIAVPESRYFGDGSGQPGPFATVAAILMASLVFGGIPYLVFAVIIFVVIGRLSATSTLVALTWSAPILFLPVHALVSMLFFLWARADPNLDDLAAFILGTSVYAVVIGYGYVAIANVAYLVGRKRRWIRDA